jgi:hypothetical protein
VVGRLLPTSCIGIHVEINNRSKIIITSRRPIKTLFVDSRVQFVALDFLDPVDEIVAKMKPLCGYVTHAFFASYVHSDDFKLLREKNVPLFDNFLNAVDRACPMLERVSLQTGGKVRLCYYISTFMLNYSSN